MNFTAAIEAFFASDTGRYAALVLILPLTDWVLGVLAAIRDGTFTLDSLAAFLRKHIAGRVLPIWVLMFLGYVTQSLVIPVVEWPVFASLGTAAALAYIAETIGSILRSWGPTEGPALLTRDTVQPTPTD